LIRTRIYSWQRVKDHTLFADAALGEAQALAGAVNGLGMKPAAEAAKFTEAVVFKRARK
jgi:hypothetical protein